MRGIDYYKDFGWLIFLIISIAFILAYIAVKNFKGGSWELKLNLEECGELKVTDAIKEFYEKKYRSGLLKKNQGGVGEWMIVCGVL